MICYSLWMLRVKTCLWCLCSMLSTYLERHFDLMNKCLLWSHTDEPSKYELQLLYFLSYIHTSNNTSQRIYANTRVYLRSIVRWSQSTTSGGMLLCLPDIFSIYGTDDNVDQSVTSQRISHKNGLERLDSHINFFFFFFMRSLADKSVCMHKHINFIFTCYMVHLHLIL